MRIKNMIYCDKCRKPIRTMQSFYGGENYCWCTKCVNNFAIGRKIPFFVAMRYPQKVNEKMSNEGVRIYG